MRLYQIPVGQECRLHFGRRIRIGVGTELGFPPRAGSKKDALRLRSVSSLVIATASTGRESNSSRAAIANDRKIVGFVQVLYCLSLC